MIRKILVWCTVAVLCFIYGISSDEATMRDLTNYRFAWDAHFRANRARFADLYAMSSGLPSLKLPPPSFELLNNDCPELRQTTLVVIGDSYVADKLQPKYLCGVKKYLFSHWDDGIMQRVALEDSTRHVLYITTTERYFRSRLSNADRGKKILPLDTTTVVAATNAVAAAPPPAPDWGAIWLKRLFNPVIEQNLEFNLFDYELFRGFREGKASLTYAAFHRVNGAVILSHDGTHAFLSETIDPKSSAGINNPLSDDELAGLVKNLNTFEEYYRKMGFDEVHFCIIPNPVEIVDPSIAPYNGLIPRIQQHPDLKVKPLDLWTPYKAYKTPKALYYPADSHWTNEGLKIFVELLNQQLSDVGLVTAKNISQLNALLPDVSSPPRVRVRDSVR